MDYSIVSQQYPCYAIMFLLNIHLSVFLIDIPIVTVSIVWLNCSFVVRVRFADIGNT